MKGIYLEAKVGTVEVASSLANGSGVPRFRHSDDGTSGTAASSEDTGKANRKAGKIIIKAYTVENASTLHTG